jgi:predicted phosphodiesterase
MPGSDVIRRIRLPPNIDCFAAVSDIHGNLPALEAVISHIEAKNVLHVVNLGDNLSGPLWPVETGERLMALGWPTIAGNHDRQLLDRPVAAMGENDAFAAERLTPDLRRWTSRLPPTLVYAADVFLCHGTPQRDNAYWLHRGRRGEMREATIAEIADDAVSWPLALCGHTHLPRVVEFADGRIVANPGSVGFPACQDDLPSYNPRATDAPQARYLIAERAGKGWTVSLQAVEYDFERAAQQADRNGRGNWARALRTGHMPKKRS